MQFHIVFSGHRQVSTAVMLPSLCQGVEAADEETINGHQLNFQAPQGIT
jgi:hypothetical protein